MTQKKIEKFEKKLETTLNVQYHNFICSQHGPFTE